MNVIMISAICVALCLLLALDAEKAKALLTEAFMFFGRIVMVVMEHIGSAITAISGFARAQLSDGEEETPSAAEGTAVSAAAKADDVSSHEGTGSQANSTAAPALVRGRYHLNRIIMAVVFTALSIVFLTADIYFYRLTFAAMGLGNGDVSVPASIDILAAAVLIAVAAFWGLILIDLHRGTHLLPSQFIQGSARRFLAFFAYASLTAIVVTGLLVGIWRTHQLVDTPQAGSSGTAPISAGGGLQFGTQQAQQMSTGPGANAAVAEGSVDQVLSTSWIDFVAPAALNIVITVLVLLSSAVSFTGTIYLVKYLAIFAIGVLLLPLVILLMGARALQEIILTAVRLKDTAIDWLAAIGQRIIDFFGDVFGEPYRDAVQAFHDWFAAKVGRDASNVADEAKSGATTESTPAESVAEEIRQADPADSESDTILGDDVEDLGGWNPLGVKAPDLQPNA